MSEIIPELIAARTTALEYAVENDRRRPGESSKGNLLNILGDAKKIEDYLVNGVVPTVK